MKCEMIKAFFDMNEALSRGQKAARDYGTGHQVFHAEMLMLDAIESKPDMNVSELSDKLCVTKSAVTQLSGKLLEKGLIEKYTLGHNKKERYFRLTDAGAQVIQAHLAYHQRSSDMMQKYLCSLSLEDKAVLLRFFEQVKACDELCVFTCQCNAGCGLGTEKTMTEEVC